MNVLIVGLGSIGMKHVKVLRQINPNVSITALRSSKGAKDEEGIKNIYNWDEVKSSPDFILIANPTSLHKEAIENAIQFDCPLFIEKPVLCNTEGADKLINELRKRKTLTYTACNLRFHPCINFLKDYLSTSVSKINEVNIYCGSDLAQWRPKQDYKKSYSAHAVMGGGVHLDLIHEIDYCCWLFGLPVDSVNLKRTVSLLGIDSFDFAAFHLNYPSFTANIVLNYYRKRPKRSIEIVYEEGELYADLLNCRVTLNEDEIFSNPSFKMQDTYLEQMNYFVLHAQKGEPVMNDFFEALDILKIAVN